MAAFRWKPARGILERLDAETVDVTPARTPAASDRD